MSTIESQTVAILSVAIRRYHQARNQEEKNRRSRSGQGKGDHHERT